MRSVRVRFVKPVILGAEAYAAGDEASLEAGLAAIAIDGRVAIVVEPSVEEAVAPPAPERAVSPRARKAK